MTRRETVNALLVALFPPLLIGATVALRSPARVETTIQDFFFGGSQPNGIVQYESFRGSTFCKTCHATDKDDVTELAIYGPWHGSMMAQAARDPLFHACLAVANQDAAASGDLCIRCHTPGGWISGRSTPQDGSKLLAADRDGVSCSVCHRMVDPVFKPGVSPPADARILANLTALPPRPGNGGYVMDPEDVRRGPYFDVTNPGHTWLPSPFHRTAALCGTCHDVSNPAYQRQDDGTHALGALNAAHETGDPADMFPIERTYSEWLNSAFAAGGVDMGGRFGGLKQVVSTCQDCHMPTVEARGCEFGNVRGDLASHDFAGGNAWVQEMILNLYPDDPLNESLLHAGQERARSMLRRAATLEADQQGNAVVVRVINETGHKLPTGYPEGRRMWINVRFFDESMNALSEHGAYDAVEAELSVEDTKVYEAELGVDDAVAQAAGLPPGKSFHFVLNNVVMKDNRIPPRGFINAAFRSVQASPVVAAYFDGQHWDDTPFRIPHGAASMEARLYYQTASKDYITFLRDENRTNDAGDVLYEQWEWTGKSPPVLMGTVSTSIGPFAIGDGNGDGVVDLYDLPELVQCLTGPGVDAGEKCSAYDINDDGRVDLRDVSEYQSGFGE